MAQPAELRKTVDRRGWQLPGHLDKKGTAYLPYKMLHCEKEGLAKPYF
jgi:hypothetical protein